VAAALSGRPDALLVAGHITCSACDEASYPTAAEWVTGTLVLASYDRHHARCCPIRPGPAGLVLLDLGQPDQTVPRVHRPRLCRATAVTTGQPCRAAALPGSGYCHHHNPARRPAS
jgi:hypothetical protein